MNIRYRLWRAAVVRGTIAAAIVLAAGACATMGTGAAQEGATLEVENQSSNMMTIYALRGAERVRLGQVQAVSKRDFRIPATMVNGVSLRFLADPLASDRTPVSHEVTVWAGDTVTMIIPPF